MVTLTKANTITDYYPGGMTMPGRKTVGGELYRYGYQGEFAETDPETGKPMFQLRLYDPRINRWLSPDPAGQYASPYLAMGNNWINKVDPDGGCDSPGEGDCGGFKRFWYNITGRSDQVKAWNDMQNWINEYGGEKLDNVVIGANGNQLDRSTVGQNLFGLTYPGGENPTTFSGLPDYTFVPKDLSEYPAIGHDRRYDNLDVAGALGLFTDTRAIGADYRFVSEELQIAANPFLPLKTRIYAGTLGVGLGLAAYPKTIFKLIFTPNNKGVQDIILYYHISNHGVTNTPDKQ